jgi:hypothetical protein
LLLAFLFAALHRGQDLAQAVFQPVLFQQAHERLGR